MRFVRACLLIIAGGVMLGLGGCSNGYGGWYWQMPHVSTPPVTMNQSQSGNQSHATSGTSQTQNNKG
jgi:hypothetical protein